MNNQDWSSQFIPLFAALFSGLIILLIAFIVWRLFRRLLRSFKKHVQIFGANPSIRIVGLGIVTLIFSRTVLAIIIVPVRFLIRLVSYFPEASIKAFDRVGTLDKQALNQIFRTSFGILQEQAGYVVGVMYDLLKDFPFIGLFICLALWVVIGQFLSVLFGKELEDLNMKSGKGRFIHFFQNIPKPMGQNIILLAVFLISAYLSIAAIVAIPWLEQNEAPALLKTEQLEQRLRGSLKSRDEYDRRFPLDYALDFNPFAESEKYLADLTAGQAKEPSEPVPDEVKGLQEKWINAARQSLDEQKTGRKNLIAKWNDFQKKSWDHQEELLKIGLSDFETNTQIPMSEQERALYFKRLLYWYRSNLNKLDNQLTEAIKFMDTRDRILEAWSYLMKSSLEDAVDNLRRYITKKAGESEMLPYWDMSSLYSSLYTGGVKLLDERLVFQLPHDLDILPQPPEPGIGWGIFGLVSRWLLRTRSLALALISGMLGFGLLGSAVSSFVRERIGREPGELLVKDLVSVIIRGVSAAVVVFLAVEGGMAVFSTGPIKPNPYVIFFTCLVGAVFSEWVWEWARKRIEGNLSTKDASFQAVQTPQEEGQEEKKEKERT